MSAPKQGIAVSRSYIPDPNQCARALELLLKEPVSKKAAHPGRPDGTRGGSSDSSAKTIIQSRTP